MANLVQLRMLENLNGFILVDKPSGIAFSTVIKAVKRKFNLVKLGHGGSLDTMASGLMVLLVNDANKIADVIMGADRVYSGTMRLGIKTDTCDIFGRRLEQKSATFPEESLQPALKEFRGDIFQREPRFCSVRREGAVDYEVADTGEHSQFLTHVYRFSILPDDVQPGRLRFSINATKSLIVRSLVDGFGDMLGCGACLDSLRREKIGKFDVADALGFDELLQKEIGDFTQCVQPIAKALR